jgi:DNA-binding LytR/AlgR family response regulator
MTLRALIVDDEPLAQDILQHYIVKTPGLESVGVCNNALEAFGLLGKVPVDVLFLDVNMPEVSGIELLRSLKHTPKTILTTAYPEFALTAYELDVVDYLMKPISFERFLKAVHKLQQQAPAQQAVAEKATGPEEPDILFVKTEGRLVRIDLGALWLAEGMGDYVRLHTDGAPIMVHSTMKHMEDQLCARKHFLRVSKSYIVNMRFITEVDGNAIRIKGQSVSIGATYRDEVLRVLNGYKLL